MSQRMDMDEVMTDRQRCMTLLGVEPGLGSWNVAHIIMFEVVVLPNGMRIPGKHRLKMINRSPKRARYFAIQCASVYDQKAGDQLIIRCRASVSKL
jgi:hypothetical protein